MDALSQVKLVLVSGKMQAISFRQLLEGKCKGLGDGNEMKNYTMTQNIGYTGSKATDEKATSSLFVSCLLVGEKVAFLSAQKATMKIFIFGHATGWICLKMLF